MKLTAAEIAQQVNGQIFGNSAVEITQVSKIEDATQESLCFLSNKKYAHFLDTTKAGIILVDEKLDNIPEHLTVIKCQHPYVAFCQMLIYHFNYSNKDNGIHDSAVVDSTAQIGANVHIGPNTFIGPRVKIGDDSKILANCSIYEDSTIGKNSIIYPNVSVYYQSEIGNNCIIHSGTVIGSDGFGHAPLPDGTYVKIPQIGNVIIHDDVEIGSNCSIDRANMGSTIIHKGCRIDNLIQIAHGVSIGEHTVIAAQTGVSGSTKVGSNVVVGGQVGFAGHIEVANKVQIGAKSGVTKSVTEEGIKVLGNPIQPMRSALKHQAMQRSIPKLEERIKQLEQKIKSLTDA